MSNVNGALKCDMKRECKQAVTYIDNKGYAYCTEHGVERRSYRPCRKLAPGELEQLKAGIPLASY